MSSWRRSACYPRSTFYPLSDGPSMRNHRITISVFRPCSTCRSHSQARLCHCTLRTVTNRIEGTFESLRYSFGGDHPSQTTHQTLSPLEGVRLRMNEGWYFKVDSTEKLAPPLRNLPPILHIVYPKSMLSYSEGSRGLSVPLRVPGIFTGTTISPSSWLRQCSNSYTVGHVRTYRQGISLP